MCALATGGGRRAPLPSGVWSDLRTRLALLLLGARARTACVSNIEQLPQVCSAMIVGGVDGERGLCSRLYGNPEPYDGLFSSIPNRD